MASGAQRRPPRASIDPRLLGQGGDGWYGCNVVRAQGVLLLPFQFILECTHGADRYFDKIRRR